VSFAGEGLVVVLAMTDLRVFFGGMADVMSGVSDGQWSFLSFFFFGKSGAHKQQSRPTPLQEQHSSMHCPASHYPIQSHQCLLLSSGLLPALAAMPMPEVCKSGTSFASLVGQVEPKLTHPMSFLNLGLPSPSLAPILPDT